MKSLKKTYLPFTILTLLTTVHGLQAENVAFNPNRSVSQESDCCVAPIFRDNSSNSLHIDADVLYWKAHLSALELDAGRTSMSEVITDGVSIFTTDEFDTDPHFKWKTGYRIAAGYQFDCSNWELAAIWTHFQDNGNKNISEDSTTTNTTKCRIQFNQIDGILVYHDTKCSSFNFTPFFGVRGARIHEGIRAHLVTDISIAPSTTATETKNFDDSQRYWGVGPIVGLQGDWDIGCGFSIYGTAAAALLYGKYKIHFDDSDVFTAPINRQVFGTIDRHTHGFDCNIDLALGVQWQTEICECYQLNFKLGFEHHQYFNHSHLGVTRGDLTFDGGIFSVGLAI